MAITLTIPRDIRKYETKLIGPFTTRQTIGVAIAAIIGVPIYFLASRRLTSDASIIIALVLMTPSLAIGFIRPYGMPLEQFIRSVGISMFLAPKKRVYKTKDVFKSTKSKAHKKKLSKKEHEAIFKAKGSEKAYM